MMEKAIQKHDGKGFLLHRVIAEFTENERYHVRYLSIFVAYIFSNYFQSFSRSFRPKIEYFDIFN